MSSEPVNGKDRVAGTPAGHENWRSMTGFVLATIGSAIGLGDVWRFAYVAGAHGGGLFLLIYGAMLLLICMPLLIAELAVGKTAQRAPDRAFTFLLRADASPAATAAPRGLPIAGALGWLSVAAAFVTISYYSVICGWVYRYLFLYLASSRAQVAAAAGDGAFTAFIAQPLLPLAWHALAMAVCALIVAAGVRDGIERAVRWLLPMLFVLLVLLIGFGLSLPDAGKGLRFLFVPDWSQWNDPNLYLAALGQAFFSIGLASGCLMAYGSYAGASTSLPLASVSITLADTLASLIAGTAIFIAVFSFGHEPSAGPTLAFVTLPELFARMPAGQWVGIGFFLLLAIAATTSAVSLLEVPVAVIVQRWAVSRRRASLIAAGAAFLAGVPASLGYGPLRHLSVNLEGAGQRLPLLDALDTVLSEYLLPLNGLAIALFVGWWWDRAAAVRGAGLSPAVGRTWLWLLRHLVPATIAAVVISSVVMSVVRR